VKLSAGAGLAILPATVELHPRQELMAAVFYLTQQPSALAS
jgi:hypothetical protein